ncbi:MAG: hypothetical protein VX762_02150 [Bacteroidota bacterium]|nr:hypothetical protein [Bacteroidota bacterium]
MQVINRRFLYAVSQDFDWAWSHCHKPTPIIIDENTIRVYFGTRSKAGLTRTTFVDLDATDIYNIKVKYIHDKPVFDLGKIGTFDDSGANVSSIVHFDNKIYMYYIGWNPSTTVHTRNSIGVVVSDDNGYVFNRIYDGSILDRNKNEPYYTGAVDVKKEEGIWKIWYTSGKEWKIINNKPEIQYYIKYAESSNGIDWIRKNIDCILPAQEFEATARPSVIYEDNLYKMWYSKRRIDGFRIDPVKNYRVGYAESQDGKKWKRLDDKIDFNMSNEGWDSEAIAYPYILKFKNKTLCFYNGNGFGRSGFGYAIIETH